jgi:hypothetical protein
MAGSPRNLRGTAPRWEAADSIEHCRRRRRAGVACCATSKFVYNIKIAGENANAVHSEEADVHSQSRKLLDLEPFDPEPANAGMGL